MEQEEVKKWALATASALRAMRGEAGLSQVDVERRTGITRTSYRMYERADRQPTVVQLAAISEAFGISFSRLMAEISSRVR